MRSTAYHIIRTLHKAGFEAYLVGGCVRDKHLGHEPKDYDVATSATPDEVGALFKKTIEVGKKFGVMVVHQDGHDIEVATFRTEKLYCDGRRPEEVTFATAREDAQRRDFTINGLFYDIERDQYLDFVGGEADLERGVLRFIGDPEERIQEDFLRILRAVRFKNRFELEYSEGLRKILAKHASLVIDISGERIFQELSLMLLDQSRRAAFEDLRDMEMLKIVLPEIADLGKVHQPLDHHKEGDVLTHTLQALEQLRPGVSLRCAVSLLCHDMGKRAVATYTSGRIRFPSHAEKGAEMVGVIADRFRWSRRLREDVQWLVHHHHVFDQWGDMKRATQLHYYDDERFQDLLNLHRADIFGSTPSSFADRETLRDQLESIQRDYYDAISEKSLPKDQSELLSGKEIMEILDIEPGPEVQRLKDALREVQLHGEVKTKEEASEWIIELTRIGGVTD